MTPLSELDRLFRDIPKPDPLCGGSAERWCLRCFHEVDADETNHGPCALSWDCVDEDCSECGVFGCNGRCMEIP